MAKDSGSSHKKSGSYLGTKKDDSAGFKRPKSSSKALHTVNIADKHRTNNNKLGKLFINKTFKRVSRNEIIKKTEGLRARPSRFSSQVHLVGDSDRKDLFKLGFILSERLSNKDNASVFRAHHLKTSPGCGLRRKYNVWCKVRTVCNEGVKESDIDLLSKFHHQNVASLYHVVRLRSKSFIFATGCTHGTVLSFLVNYGPLIENHARVWFRQILNGLDYLHSNQITHGDLNCENIFIGDRHKLVIGQFGRNEFLRKNSRDKLCNVENKSMYSAPEVLLGQEYNPRMADMWSLGVVLFVFLMGESPFRYYGNENEDIASLVVDQLVSVWKNKKYTRKLSPSTWTVLLSLLQPDVLNRAHSQALKNSSFFSMKECTCGYGSFKALAADILGALPDLYLNRLTAIPLLTKIELKDGPKINPLPCSSLRQFFNPKKNSTLKIEDLQNSNSEIISISDDHIMF